MTDDRFGQCCLTCEHWEGDRVRVLAKIAEFGKIVMDPDRGWPEDGKCGVLTGEVLCINIYGDATVEVEVPANFGCIRHMRCATH